MRVAIATGNHGNRAICPTDPLCHQTGIVQHNITRCDCVIVQQHAITYIAYWNDTPLECMAHAKIETISQKLQTRSIP